MRHGPRTSDRSQSKIENVNQVSTTLENLLQEKLSNDSILLAWPIRHAAWTLTKFQMRNDGRTAPLRDSGKAYTSQLPFGERVMYEHTALLTGNLNQRWNHGIWIGEAPMTDECIIPTENGVQKAKSLHRVTPKEKFLISELEKAREFPWNDVAENSKSAIEARHNQNSSGHRRMHLTVEIVLRIGAKPGCSGCAGSRSHTEACRVRSRRTFADAKESESSRAVGAGVGSIAKMTVELQQEPTQNIQNELMDSPTEMGAQEHREQRRVRLNETLPSEMSKRPVVRAKSAHPSMIAPMMERLGSTVLLDPAPSNKDETTTGNLHAINGIDVVTALVPEEDVWQFEVTKTCAREIQFQDGEQESVAIVDREDPSVFKTINVCEARTGEKLDSKKMWKKRKAKEVQEFDEFEVKAKVVKSEIRTTPRNTKGSKQALVRVVWSQPSRKQYSVEIKDQVYQEMWMVEWLF